MQVLLLSNATKVTVTQPIAIKLRALLNVPVLKKLELMVVQSLQPKLQKRSLLQLEQAHAVLAKVLLNQLLRQQPIVALLQAHRNAHLLLQNLAKQNLLLLVSPVAAQVRNKSRN